MARHQATPWVRGARTLAFCVFAVVAVSTIGVLLGADPAHASTFTVTSTSDAADFALDGSCDVDPRFTVAVCTLRAAIEEANNRIANPGVDTINFNIPTTDPKCNATTHVCTISPSQALPTITQAVKIDGYTQRSCSSNPTPCSRPNTSTVGTNAVLLVQINGANAIFSQGLKIEAFNSVVKGLVINRFGGAGIFITRPNEFDVTGNRIEGNFIGTNVRGTADLGNGSGAFVDFASDTTVGGTSRAARNLISGNGADGIVVNASGTKVLGNLIGTDHTGTNPLGNDGDGVAFYSGNNTLGADTGAGANVIAFSGENGVAMLNSFSTGNAIPRNSIFSNGGLGIDLGDDGRTPNDPGDADTGTGGLGGNNFQNFPVLTSAQSVGDTSTVRGRLNSTPSTGFVVRFFANPSNDNEGRRYLGQMSVTTDASGNTGTFTFAPTRAVLVGQNITATATDPGSNTSEFSAPRSVT